MAIILKANKVNLFVSPVLFVFWYHSPNILDTPRIDTDVCVRSTGSINGCDYVSEEEHRCVVFL
jgi:hypothetical protein